MRPLFWLGLVALAACASAEKPAPAETAAGVEGLIREWSAAGADSRWDDLKALYANDPEFHWIEQGRVAYADYAAVAAGVDQIASTGATIKSAVDDINVTPLSADTASFRAHAAIGVATPDFSFDFDGAFSGVAVLRDGRWRFLQGHLSKAEAARQP